MKFDFKITTWERVTVEDSENESNVLKAIKEGKINSADDVFYFLEDRGELGLINAYCKVLEDTSEQMSVNENGGNATIEVIEGTETIFTNQNKKDKEEDRRPWIYQPYKPKQR